MSQSQDILLETIYDMIGHSGNNEFNSIYVFMMNKYSSSQRILNYTGKKGNIPAILKDIDSMERCLKDFKNQLIMELRLNHE